MSAARLLLDELAMIGATVVPAGEDLILRAGPRKAIPAALVGRVRNAKRDLLFELAANHELAFENGIVRWLDQNPRPSFPGRCAWCCKPETATAMVVPFGTVPGTHTWLHSECWPAWSKARREVAIVAVTDDALVMQGQSRTMSLVEAVTNVVVGFGLAVGHPSHAVPVPGP